MPGDLPYCPNCGTRTERGAAFCGECGRPIEEFGPDGFDVILQRIGSRKIEVIKVVREVTGLNLAAVKTLVESAPATVKTNVNRRDVEQIKAQLDVIGATVEIRPTGTSHAASPPQGTEHRSV